MDSPTSVLLGGVWGSGPDDVFVVGDEGTIAHYDGESWQVTLLDSGEHLQAVWGSGPEDVFAVGLESAILHYDGERWRRMEAPTLASLYGVWGSAPTPPA
ncbi:hypothetical protein [Sorangium sp. So ce128]|uniref:hypothetical protein n=1 Tax=Sorangium sp. So ce128 TaxID=3133281 RepID=UPI003F645580